MAQSMIEALGILMRLQRWNAMPRVEIWTEAENIAYVTHTVYAVGKKCEMKDEVLYECMSRTLLKSFSKHHISDILAPTRDVIRELSTINVWEKIVDEAAKESSYLFPNEIRIDVERHMKFEANYSANCKYNKNEIEDLLTFAREKAALKECAINSKVYHKMYQKLQRL